MTWECSTPQPQDQFLPVAGFSFDLGDLGCGAQWKQRWTVRPEPTLAPTRLILEPYGNAANYRSLWLKPSPGGGWAFNQKVGRLLVKGKVNQVDVNQGLSVTLTKANHAGASVCTPGTYLLPPEDGC